MSSRVVTFALSAAQRERLNTAVRVKARAQVLNRGREQAALRSWVGQLRTMQRLVDLPRDQEIDEAFGQESDQPAVQQRRRQVVERVELASRTHRTGQVARLATNVGDKHTERDLRAILDQLPQYRPIPEDVSTLVCAVRDNQSERSGLLDELRVLVGRTLESDAVARRSQEKLDRIRGILEIIADDAVSAMLSEAEAATGRGDTDRVAELAQACEQVLERALEPEVTDEVSYLLAELWSQRGYTVTEVDGRVVAYRDGDVTAVPLDVQGSSARITQVGIDGSRASDVEVVESMRSHCRVAEAVEQQARARGWLVTVGVVDEPTHPPRDTVSLDAARTPGVGDRTHGERQRRDQPARSRQLDGGPQ